MIYVFSAQLWSCWIYLIINIFLQFDEEFTKNYHAANMVRGPRISDWEAGKRDESDPIYHADTDYDDIMEPMCYSGFYRSYCYPS